MAVGRRRQQLLVLPAEFCWQTLRREDAGVGGHVEAICPLAGVGGHVEAVCPLLHVLQKERASILVQAWSWPVGVASW